MEYPLPKVMINLYSKVSYKGKLLSRYRSVVVGPWCVSKDYRGGGVFMNMWDRKYFI